MKKELSPPFKITNDILKEEKIELKQFILLLP